LYTNSSARGKNVGLHVAPSETSGILAFFINTAIARFCKEHMKSTILERSQDKAAEQVHRTGCVVAGLTKWVQE
jgi:hypothetical protein